MTSSIRQGLTVENPQYQLLRSQLCLFQQEGKHWNYWQIPAFWKFCFASNWATAGLSGPYSKFGLSVSRCCARSSVHQVLDFGVDEWTHDCAGPVQDGAALEQRSRFGAPRLGLEVEVDRVQRHGKEVSNEGHGFGCQPGKNHDVINSTKC